MSVWDCDQHVPGLFTDRVRASVMFWSRYGGRVARHVVVGDLRVQQIERKDGRRSWTIVWPEGTVHTEADRFLRLHDGSGTQRTYAYLLVDHLRWLERECLTFTEVQLRDLERYMGILGAEVRMPLGEPWRVGKRPYGHSALSTAAACLKGFYPHQSSLGINGELGKKLDKSRLPSRVDRRRSFLGHVKSSLPTNPLAPKGPHRRHPKMLPDGARERLLETVNAARDRLVVTWLADGGLRIGELCGLHLVDLHLRENAACGECRAPHLHVCHRSGNPNRAEAKTKHPWRVEHGIVTGGLIKTGQPRDGAHLLRVRHHRVPARRRARHAPGPAARRRYRTAMGGRGQADARPGRETRWPGAGETPCLPALVHVRGSRRRQRQHADRPRCRRLGVGGDGG
ncbi:hypothetical protein GCM10010307_03220 [Streptomyces vastus]|uniref:Tyr recombinase domain-containing protein n=1 Tax=Streptomyces vastus TaxID=285451 RepID=A0ABN3Q8K4_9ACTN